MPEDRYQPLPGLLELPGFLLGKLGPRGRRIAAVVGVLIAVGATVGLILGIPAIEASKRARAQADARATARARAARLAELRKQVRPVSGRGPAAHTLSARRALRADLLAAIRTDSLRRVRTGEFDHAPRSIQCEQFPYQLHTPDPVNRPGVATARYSCLAVTATIHRASYTSAGVIGYPYRALVDFPRGRFTFCRISGRPGEMLIDNDVSVPVPAACGGLRG